MSALLASVRRTMARHSLCPPGTRTLVALSGGSDSVALLHLLGELAERDRFTIAGIAHFNHQLRNAASGDEAFCRDLARRLGHPFFTATADIQAEARRQRRSVEDAARRARYTFLDTIADEVGATRVATGHTRDDQAETFLLKLSRGAGLSGLGGIYPARGRIIRPLLDVTRSALRAYLQARGERWVEDVTNADIDNPRNLVRHVVLPQLVSALGPSLVDAIARSAALAAEDGRWLDDLAAERLSELASPGDRVALSAVQLRSLPGPLSRRVLLQAMRSESGKEISAGHVEAALDVLERRERAAETPAGRWELLGEKLVLLSRALGAGAESGGTGGPFRYDLAVPGAVSVTEADCVIAACRVPVGSASQLEAADRDSRRAVTIAGIDVDRLVVRSRRPGDRVTLADGRGHKKVQDLFVDAKVPRLRRNTVPLVADPDGRVIWVPGHALSADFRAVEVKQPVIRLTFTRFGENA